MGRKKRAIRTIRAVIREYQRRRRLSPKELLKYIRAVVKQALEGK